MDTLTWCKECRGWAKPSCSPSNSVTTYADAVQFVAKNATTGRLALLCGAGISVWAPSNKPLGDPLRDEILASIDLRGPKHSKEMSLEYVVARVGWGVEGCLTAIFSGTGSRPNAWHRLIAQLVKAGCASYVFTTNFDPMLNRCLCAGRTGWRCPRDFLVVSNEIYEVTNDHFCSSAGPKPEVFYLHGTYHTDSMCVLASHVEDPGLMTTRVRPLATFLENSEVLLLTLGYSRRDRDVAYVLNDVRDKCRGAIVCVERAENNSAVGLSELDRCFGSLKGFRVTVPDYGRFIRDLQRALNLPVSRRLAQYHNDASWKSRVAAWAADLPREAHARIAKRLSDNPSLGGNELQCVIDTGVAIVTIAGDVVMINVDHPGDRDSKMLSDINETSGVLISDFFNRRIRSLGYLRDSGIVKPPISVGDEYCSLKERELLVYIGGLINAKMRSQRYHMDRTYRKFIRYAMAVLSSHMFLHGLSEA